MKKYFLGKRIFILLTLVTLLSYGQLLRMNFWQDDNAVVFKFTHINEDAGYLGKGIFGEGAYRYTITPYLPIFYLFGYNPVPYFTMALFFLLLSVYTVYLFFRFVFEKKIMGAVAGLLYASGYIASDGFIRMFNSILTSTSVILVCSTIGFYYAYIKKRRILFYFFSIFFYYLAVEIGYIRTHYLFFVIIFMELIFTIKNVSLIKKLLKDILFSLFRILPFFYIFYRYYILGGDERSRQVFVLIKSLLKGEFYNTYSFFGSLGNILLSNEFFFKLYGYIHITEKQAVVGLMSILLVITVYFLKRKLISTKLATIYSFISIVILILAKQNFAYQGLVGGFNEKISAYFGTFFVLVSILLFKILPNKKLAAMLSIWAVFNLGAYASYIPIYAYPSDNRYFLHTFIPLIGLLVLWVYGSWEKFKKDILFYIPVVLVLFWGIINLFSSLNLENEIITHRSNPSKRFFSKLQSDYPSIQKDSIFYFYIPDKSYAQAHYNAGFSVAQMPEETAIAWRYGMDRYDLKIVNNFVDLQNYILSNNTPISKIYAFIADPQQLIDVTGTIRDLLQKGSYQQQTVNSAIDTIVEKKDNGTKLTLQYLRVKPANVYTITPVNLTIYIKADPLVASDSVFPLQVGDSSGSIEDINIRKQYLNYRNWKGDYYKSASISATTAWKDFKIGNLLDLDQDSYWEADRIAWSDHNQGFTVDLGKELSVGGIIYKNGPQSLTPTQFDIQVSKDNKNFVKVKDVSANLSKRDDIQKIVFVPSNARYVKITFHKTQYDDAPGISEIEVLPEEFVGIDPVVAERFFRFSFSKVNSLNEWQDLLNSFRNEGLVKISWKTNSSDNTQSSVKSTVPVIYNGLDQTIKLQIPAGGEKLEYLEILPLTIPGKINISKIIYENVPLPKL